MLKKLRASAIIFFICALFVSSGQSDLVSKNKAEQEVRIQEQIAAMKADPYGLFYVRSELSSGEQEQLARKNIDEIQKLTNVEGFDTPDYDKIMALAREILLKAPDTRAAQMTHWNIHTIYLTVDDRDSAEKVLESYIDKYPDDEWTHQEAFDKLCVFAGKRDDWGTALYYADKILENTPDRYALVLTKARALLYLGDKEEGKKLLERILAEDEGSVQFNLAMMEMDDLLAGKYDKSVQQESKEDLPESDLGQRVLVKKPAAKETVEQKVDSEKIISNDPLLVEYYNQTMQRMKQLTMGVQVFYLDNMKLPSSLQELLEGGFAREEHMRDAWGRPFHFKADPGNETCWIASAGSDGRFEGFDQKGTYSVLPGKDIIAYDTDFVFAPDFK
ncbi:MAG: type II secretion system protein GspG [Candidatus Aminicenantes bacterium]|nr:type II secretion system protein GspG [Candidatus Aminicenantes bacterium]